MKKQSSENKLVITEEFIFDQNKLSKDPNNHFKYYVHNPIRRRIRSVVDRSFVHCHGGSEFDPHHCTFLCFFILYFIILFIYRYTCNL